MSARWSEADDIYVERPDVPGHEFSLSAAGRNFVIACTCGWTSEPLHLINLTTARNQHRIEVAP